MRKGGRGRLAVAVGLVLFARAGAVRADSVRHLLRTGPVRVGLPEVGYDQRYQNAADGLLDQAVRNLPIHPASSPSFTYKYDPSCKCFQRTSNDYGPWFLTERPETLGQGLLHTAVTVGEYNVRCVNGCKAGDEFDPIGISVGRVKLKTPAELLYTVATLNLAYGVTNDLDVYARIPVGALDFGQNLSATASGQTLRASTHTDAGPNLMDIQVGAKYRLFTLGGFTGAGGFRARLPTGNPRDGLGTGHGEVGPYVSLSKSLLGGWLGNYWDAGIDVDVNETRRTSGHYSWGMVLQPPEDSAWHRVALTGSVGGRSEIDGIRHRESVSGPHVTRGGVQDEPYLCFDPARHDYFDATLGVRVGIWRTLAMTLGFYKAINPSEGVRASGFSPAGSVEATF